MSSSERRDRPDGADIRGVIEPWASLVAALGLPYGDAHDLPVSPARFLDGGAYRIEIPSVEGPAALAAALEAAATYGVSIHRVSQGSGITLLSDDDLRQLARLGAGAKVEVCLFVGPRAPWEGSAGALTRDGLVLGWRHTGMDQVRYAFDDVMRAVEAGIRSVLVADEGLAWLVCEARRQRLLPSDLVVKASALLGLANPAGIRLISDLGLDSVNIASDTSLARLAAIRQAVSVPVDLYIESPDSLGGFTRYHEVPEIIRVGAPIYLKFGLRNAPNLYPSGEHLEGVAVATARERVRRASLALELLAHRRDASPISPVGSTTRGIPIA